MVHSPSRDIWGAINRQLSSKSRQLQLQGVNALVVIRAATSIKGTQKLKAASYTFSIQCFDFQQVTCLSDFSLLKNWINTSFLPYRCPLKYSQHEAVFQLLLFFKNNSKSAFFINHIGPDLERKTNVFQLLCSPL